MRTSLILLIILGTGCQNSNQPDQENKTSPSYAINSTASDNSQTGLNAGVIIYSGKCICYKKTIVEGNKLKYTPVSQSFGKLVLGLDKKSFNFFYNGEQVFSRNEYDNYIDNTKGEEGFTSYNFVDAHRFIAERVIFIEVGERLTDEEMGYHYEITSYKIN